MAEIFNTTIGQTVTVPDHQVDEYLADSRYRRVDVVEPVAPVWPPVEPVVEPIIVPPAKPIVG